MEGPQTESAPAPSTGTGLQVNAGDRQVTVDGRDVWLTQQEHRLMSSLAQHPDRTVSRSELMGELWDDSRTIDSATLTVHIRRLRLKIEPDPSSPRYLLTTWGIGYRLAP